MTQDSSQDDFLKMQEQAIKRVHEMNRKSTATHESKKDKSEEHQKNEPPRPKEAERASSFEKPKREKHGDTFSGLLGLDADMSIILPLILFLGKDGADDVLLLALLYIMS